MAKFSPFISDLATTGKGVTDTFDDKIERKLFQEEYAKIWPNRTICINDKFHPCDLCAKDSQNNIVAYMELDRAGTDWQNISWGWLSILERKEKKMLKCNEEAPVLMNWMNQSMSIYYVLNLREVDILEYELQKIPYNKNRNKKEWNHPVDFHRRIPLKYGLGPYRREIL